MNEIDYRKNELFGSFFPERKPKSIEELLKLFKDGEKRFKKNPYFNRCINQLYRGANPIYLLDQLLADRQELIKRGSAQIESARYKPKRDIY